MAGHENTMGFQHGNESILNSQSSGLSTNVSQMAASCVSMAKPSASDLANPFLGSSTWDPLVSFNPNQSFGGSSLVSHSEFANNSSYPRVLENQGMSSTSHLVQYMSDSNFAEMVSKVTSFGSGNFSEMVGSFGQPDCVDVPTNNTGYQPNFNANKGAVIERTINPAQSQNEDLAPEEGTAGSMPDGNRRKRGLDSNSPVSANKNAEGEAGKDSSGKSSDGVKEQDGKKQKFEQNSSADLRGKQAKDNSQSGEAPKENFIHVRARRGQATNSHSLAERVRREKISERMRLLQELVPGCNKITGKAVMLDEIINYVQSLQQQVEFLSMKLATVNPELNFDVERILSKDILQSHIGSGSMLGYGQGVNSSHPFPSGSFPGSIPNIPQFPPLSQNVLDHDFQRFFGMGYNSSTHLDNLGPNGRLKPEL